MLLLVNNTVGRKLSGPFFVLSISFWGIEGPFKEEEVSEKLMLRNLNEFVFTITRVRSFFFI